MVTQKTLSRLLVIVVLMAVGYYWGEKLSAHWDILRTYPYTWHMPSLLAALGCTMVAFLTDAILFQACVNRAMQQKLLSWCMGFVLCNLSTLLKYLPGTVWSYTAQVVWFSQRGLPLSRVVYINGLCSLTAVLTSVLIGAVCGLQYWALFGGKILVVLGLALLGNVVLLCASARVMAACVRGVQRYVTHTIDVFPLAPTFIVGMQMIYVCQWIFLSLGGHYALRGLGVAQPWSQLSAVLFALSFSWVAGYLSLLTPGGIGVREGVMYALLQPITDVQTALMLPIAMRVLYLLVECCFGALGSFLAVRWRIFSHAPVTLAPATP